MKDLKFPKPHGKGYDYAYFTKDIDEWRMGVRDELNNLEYLLKPLDEKLAQFKKEKHPMEFPLSAHLNEYRKLLNLMRGWLEVKK